MLTLVSHFQTQCQRVPHQTALLYLAEGETETSQLTYAELDRQARTFAAYLTHHYAMGDRILILYPPGIEFIIAFMGCLYAGIIAVPIACPVETELEKTASFLQHIAKDADIVAVLSMRPLVKQLQLIFPKTIKVEDPFYRRIKAHPYLPPAVTQQSIVYLQYTSGSTALPKAAMITHENLIHSLKATAKAWRYTAKSSMLTWAPPTHVYGLVCGLLLPLYHGTLAIVMPPHAFIARPIRWLTAMMRYRVTHSGCPNFGYAYCVKEIKDEELKNINLRDWKVAINGGEMVQYETLLAFQQKFAPCGFLLKQFHSAYGMSEASGLIASTAYQVSPATLSLNQQHLQQHIVREKEEAPYQTFVSSGKLIAGLSIKIIDPDTLLPVKENGIGEVWLSGPSIVHGYWRRAEENQQLFLSILNDSSQIYFRTGDLGFIYQDQLYLTGRLKELIVINGKKYSPLELERIAGLGLNKTWQALPRVAFSTVIAEQEQVIIMQEIDDTCLPDTQLTMMSAIHEQVMQYVKLNLYAVILVNKNALPKTNSGKLQRKACEKKYLANEFSIVNQLVKKKNEVISVSANNQPEYAFIEKIANILNISPDVIHLNAPLSQYQFDSINIIRLTNLLNESYQLTLSPASLYEYKTLGEFYIANLMQANQKSVEVSSARKEDDVGAIAIIGISGVFPGAANVDELWENLVQKKEVITPVPSYRWMASQPQWGGFIDDIAAFDADFFQLSQREAELTDPQQRLLLQTVWHAIEDAGYAVSHLTHTKTGLYIGVLNHDYAELLQKENVIDAYMTTGLTASMLANRISYQLNLQGPSEVIDTACSSSLVAIHHAVYAIQQGDCEIAIVGGVNALLSPTTFLTANEAGMLSPDGRCKTFDEKANGYVRSEGVAAILLKPLAKTLHDHDHIYAIIKGTAVNHGGRANSLTAPNPNAQADVIVTACERAHVPLQQLQYIETHGTGTALGDPIEINGLKKAFQILAKKQSQSLSDLKCGLGSVKTNIGHLESAAGLAGLIKVILAMQYEMLPPNLHFNKLNPYIDLANTPFYIVDTSIAWPRYEDKSRYAGVSSFGFGGTNAHIILQEPPPRHPNVQLNKTYPIPLSAKTEKTLRERIIDFKSWLMHSDATLSAISYTLCVGREHFAKRCLLLVNSVEELKLALNKIETNKNLISSVIDMHPDASDSLVQLANDYVTNKSIDWEKIFSTQEKQRIALPTYPFAKSFYWLPSSLQLSKVNILHPLLDANTSTMNTQSFVKQFNGNEFYWHDHEVQGQAVLPGAIYLEMAHAAAQLALNGQTVTSLSNIHWIKPFIAETFPVSMQIFLYPSHDGIAFAITNQTDRELIYAQGKLHTELLNANLSLNLDEFKKIFTQVQTSETFYTKRYQQGLQYGNTFQVIQKIWHNTNNALLAELSLPSHLAIKSDSFYLHPALLDGVLHASAALLSDSSLYLPVSIDKIQLYGALPETVFVYITRLDEAKNNEFYFDLQVTNTVGKILLTISRFTVQSIRLSVTQSSVVYYQPVWKRVPALTNSSQPSNILLINSNEEDNLGFASIQFSDTFKRLSSHRFHLNPIETEQWETIFKALEAENQFPHVIIYRCNDCLSDSINKKYEYYITSILSMIKILLTHVATKPLLVLLQQDMIQNENKPFVAAWTGFAKSLYQENPHLICRVVEAHHLEHCLSEINHQEFEVRYDDDNQRWVKYYEESDTSQLIDQSIIKQQGVYLITGGLGGLGKIFAYHLAKQYKAKLILTGRSHLTEASRHFLEQLNSFGAEVHYLSSDIANEEETRQLIHQIKKIFGKLNGVLHTAGIIDDAFLLQTTETQFQTILSAKIKGTINLDHATQHELLDFFVLFSSVASVFGNAGQSAYAYANHFMDAFAMCRQQMRQGKTLSINWPYWEEGGAWMDATMQAMIKHRLGLVPLTTKNGLEACWFSLNHFAGQCVVTVGEQQRIRQALLSTSCVANFTQQTNKLSDSNQITSALFEKTLWHLKTIVAKYIKTSPEKLDENLSFEQYGINSLVIMQINDALTKIVTPLPKTLFFEYHNLKELTQYFIKHHQAALYQLFEMSPSTISSIATSTSSSYILSRQFITEKIIDTEDIAIIGLSGRYPDADHLDEFWENLKAGKNSITSVPSARWRSSSQQWGGFLEDIDKFDPLFFHISPHEAARMDPQERLFLQTAWHTLEDAGYTTEMIHDKKVGVFVGVMYAHYQLLSEKAHSVFASIANRVSYCLNLRGPSLALDTMCSSSLTAIHLACQSLRQGECELALAGGVNLSLHQQKYQQLAAGHFLSTDGRCRSFGEGGDGYVPGEGVGAVLLKPLNKAQEDHDHIYAIIKGSSINHGGKTNGYTVPNPAAQAEVIISAYQAANVNTNTVTYLEAHGTGTQLGDPIEIAGLAKAFGARHIPCPIGSVKSNIGHLESAAGIAALTKVLLQIKHQQLVPSLHADQLNTQVDWSQIPFKVQQTLSDWHSPRVAGISSFGAGGSNAHVIIQEVSSLSSASDINSLPQLILLSAKTVDALKQKFADLYEWLIYHEKDNHLSLLDIAYTFSLGRSNFDKRCAILATNLVHLTETLQALSHDEEPAQACFNFAGKQKKQVSLSQNIFNQLMSEVVAQTTDTNYYREQLWLLANFYVDGYAIDWRRLYVNKGKKISLPGYPFAKERYWHDDVSKTSNNLPSLPQNQITQNDNLLVLTRLAAQQLNLPVARLDSNHTLQDYGMDSVGFVNLAQAINAYYQLQLTPAIFYTYPTLRALNHYLSQEHHLPEQEIISSPLFYREEKEEKPAIAIIGMNGLFPQSETLDIFWQHLVARHDLISEVPSSRWDLKKYEGDTKQNANKSYSKWGGFIEEIDTFDAEFFNLSAREANLMDPQHRLFLETVWKTIEDAGYDPFTLCQQKTGIFAGIEFNEYQVMLANAGQHYHAYTATGNSHSMLANRVSYLLNLQGPSEVIDTACSSSLVAIHRAIQAIQQGECELAVAGGVSLILNPDTYVIMSQMGALSPDGRCKTFDASANGYVKGEGVGAILLKPLKQAQQDGDYIYGVIRGSAVNHGGKAQSLTAPNANAQSALLISAYQQSQIDPATITYIEAHGTGTALGDPVEIEGLKLAFKQLAPTLTTTQIGIGSVKTNIGHLEPASGIASVIKLLLAFKHGQLPGNIHLRNVNPYIQLDHSPFYLLKQTENWHRLITSNGKVVPRRAGVSSFGFGGTNAHLILEEAPSTTRPTILTKPYYLVTISAKETVSLQKKLQALEKYLEQPVDGITLAALSQTLNLGRTHFAKRCAIVADSLSTLLSTLQAINAGKRMPNVVMSDDSAVIQLANIDLSLPINVLQYTPGNYHQLLLSLANQYCQQATIDFSILHHDETMQRIAGLPTYPFIKKRYWFDQSSSMIEEKKISQHDNHILQDETAFVINYLQTIFAEKLAIAKHAIQVNETYENYGVDSLSGLEITNRLELDFPRLSKTILFEQNTLMQLAQFLLKKYPDRVQMLNKENATTVPTMTTSTALVIKNSTKKARQSLNDDIAIIGLHGIFPMAENLQLFWQNLQQGKNCITEVPMERWDYRDYPVMVGGKEKYYSAGGFIADIDKFDPLFFNISPRDAMLMDPQERLFMQSAWSALEDAGYTRERLQQQLDNEVGVFAGVTYNFYPLLIAEEWQRGNRLPLDIQSFSIANRLSYFLNAKGPSFVIDTACSSALSAIHLACESIQRGDCQLAIAGGVNLSIHPSKYHFLGSFSFLSDDGRCASFGEGGNGYVPAEGVGAVILKSLTQAQQDGDQIYGVIKASSMNHGGKTSGYTVPNPNAQAALISQALQKAQISPRTISYIEAHGTGTSLGDPIEIRGLQEAFESFTQDKQFCAIGSVKSNIGHLESAAGISQLAKVLLQMKHQQLVPSLHAEKLNPFIQFEDSPFYVQRHLSDWLPSAGDPRRAGISSFGAGGTNVHLIVEEYSVKQPNNMTGENLFLLSAATNEQLQLYLQNVQTFLTFEENLFSTEHDLNQWFYRLCYTSQIGRENMHFRLAILANSYADFRQKLAELIEYPTQIHSYAWRAEVKTNQHQDTNLMLQQRNWKNLASAWINGANMDWQQLYIENKPGISSFPTYPFTKRRCWVTEEKATIKTETISAENILPIATLAQEKKEETKKIKSHVFITQENVTTLVLMTLSKLLGLDMAEIDPDVAYLNYGLDSIIGINFVAELNESFPDLLSPMDLYRYPDVTQLVEHILSSCESDIEETVQNQSASELISESDFMNHIAHLSDIEVAKLLENELSELDSLLAG